MCYWIAQQSCGIPCSAEIYLCKSTHSTWITTYLAQLLLLVLVSISYASNSTHLLRTLGYHGGYRSEGYNSLVLQAFMVETKVLSNQYQIAVDFSKFADLAGISLSYTWLKRPNTGITHDMC